MKIIQISLFVLGAIALLITILGLVSPKSIQTINIVEVNSPIDETFSKTKFLKNFTSWSPFLEKDPKQINSVSGEDGKVGATFHWKGVTEESEGTQRISVLEENKFIKLDCIITKPFQSAPVFEYEFSKSDKGTQIKQIFNCELKFPSNIIGLLLGLKKEMNLTNKKGLNNLKKFCEEN